MIVNHIGNSVYVISHLKRLDFNQIITMIFILLEVNMLIGLLWILFFDQNSYGYYSNNELHKFTYSGSLGPHRLRT